MSGVNKVILLGNLGKDPEIRYLEHDRMRASFTLATNETYKNKEGERVTTTEWHNVVLWTPLAFTEILLSNLVRLYEGKGPASLPVQYKDYAAWQNKRLNEETLQLQEEYWLKKLKGFVVKLFHLLLIELLGQRRIVKPKFHAIFFFVCF